MSAKGSVLKRVRQSEKRKLRNKHYKSKLNKLLLKRQIGPKINKNSCYIQKSSPLIHRESPKLWNKSIWRKQSARGNRKVS